MADPDLESVSLEMSGAQLVAVSLGFKDAQLRNRQQAHQRLGARGNAQPLARHRLAVLEPGVGNVALAQLELAGEGAHHLWRRKARLLDPEKKMLSIAAGRVGRDLLDDEVLRPGLELPGHPWNVRTDPSGPGPRRREPGQAI